MFDFIREHHLQDDDREKEESKSHDLDRYYRKRVLHILYPMCLQIDTYLQSQWGRRILSSLTSKEALVEPPAAIVGEVLRIVGRDVNRTSDVVNGMTIGDLLHSNASRFAANDMKHIR